jgi:hypothetical protein
MKITMWQQFSSNHSSHFVVVGQFEDVKQAEEAAAKLHDWMQKILWEETKPKFINEDGEEDEGRTPTEDYIVKSFGIKWYDNGMEWNGRPRSVDEVVIQHRNTVLVACPVETNDAADPVAALMDKLGAQTIDCGFTHIDMYFLLTCTAPDSFTAAYLVHHIDEQLAKWFGQQYVWMKADDTSCYVKRVTTEGCQLEIELYIGSDVYPAMRLIHYLEANGYTDIEYVFLGHEPWK